MINENSHRDKVKAAVRKEYKHFGGNIDDGLIGNMTDVVFDALGITEDEQDKCGGYFMLHAGKDESQTGEEGFAVRSGAFSSLLTTSQPRHPMPDARPMTHEEMNKYTVRTKELEEGAKYTSEEFKAYATGRRITGNYWYISLQTPICKYGQSYDKDMVLDEAKMNFVKSHYPMYLDNYERSKDVDKMDKE